MRSLRAYANRETARLVLVGGIGARFSIDDNIIILELETFSWCIQSFDIAIPHCKTRLDYGPAKAKDSILDVARRQHGGVAVHFVSATEFMSRQD